MAAPTRSYGLIIVFAVLAIAPATLADNDLVTQKPTFYGDVLPILQENCVACHRDKGANFGGMVAPMSLTTYKEVRPWAKSIAKQVGARQMPPWKASPIHHGVFANERVLNDTQIETILNWVKTGAPRGPQGEAPPPRVFEETDGWQIGRPDLVFKMPEPYFVEDDVEDLYVNFEAIFTEEQLPEDRWIKAVEFRAGSSAVHHIILNPLGGIAPGYDPLVYADGWSARLRKGTKAKWQMHYHKEPGPGTGVWDQSKVGIIFWPEGTVIKHKRILEPLGAFDFNIPAGEPNYSRSTRFTFKRDSLVMSYNPHMHLRGKSAQYMAYYPDGTEELLLDVPRYDFNWQITYRYKEPKFMPNGTVVELTTAWDNSPDNPSNPDPTVDVRYGEPTTAEMMFGWMRYADATPRPFVVGDPPREKTASAKE